MPGVVDAAVDLDAQAATVTAQDTVEPDRLVDAIREAGYHAAVREAAVEAGVATPASTAASRTAAW
ncbi:heavy-metal-associated domain-containing protein [Burkholderia cenocepacia]|uniref:heavy-metal-associated domain-containing protein n=1 Tax=Burkholderia cenocepacia TaxID=95486 RepID=UPI003F4A50A7